MKPSDMLSHWKLVRADLYTIIDMFSQDELSFTPFEGSWSVGKIMLHIADCENYWLHGLDRGEIEPGTYYDLADHPTTTTIKKSLEKTWKKTAAFLENLDENDLDQVYTTPHNESFSLRWIIWHVLEHEIHHRGELSLVLGLLGRGGLDV